MLHLTILQSERIGVCINCPHARGTLKPKGLTKRSKCGLANAKILEFAASLPSRCPDGRWAAASVGDYIAALAESLRLTRLVKLWERLTGKPCGCESRRRTANRRFAGLAEWLQEWRLRSNRRPTESGEQH